MIVQRKIHESTRGPLVIVLEDMHWYDSSSWALTHSVCTLVPHMFLLLSHRPLARPYPKFYKRIRHMSTTIRVDLEYLPAEASLQLAANKFGVPRSQLPLGVVQVILNQAQGHPLYIEELCQAMLDSKMVMLDREKGELIVTSKLAEQGKQPGMGVRRLTRFALRMCC